MLWGHGAISSSSSVKCVLSMITPPKEGGHLWMLHPNDIPAATASHASTGTSTPETISPTSSTSGTTKIESRLPATSSPPSSSKSLRFSHNPINTDHTDSEPDPGTVQENAYKIAGITSILLWCKVVLFIDVFSVALAVPLLASYFNNINADKTMWGVTVCSFQVVQIASGLFIGSISQSVNKRNMLIMTFAASSISFIMLGAGTNLWVLIGSRMIEGMKHTANIITTITSELCLCATSSASSSASMSVSVHNPFNRDMHVQHQLYILRTAGVLGPIIGGVLYQYSPIAPCVLASFCLMINTCICIFALPTTISNPNNNKPPTPRTSKYKGMRKMWATLWCLPPLALFILSTY